MRTIANSTRRSISGKEYMRPLNSNSKILNIQDMGYVAYGPSAKYNSKFSRGWDSIAASLDMAGPNRKADLSPVISNDEW